MAPQPPVPAWPMPVPALLESRRMGGPHDHVRGAGPDLLITARAPVGLGGGLTGDAPYHPLAVRGRLHLLRPEPGSGALLVAARRRAPAGQTTAWLAGHPSRQPPRLTRTHGRHCKALPGMIRQASAGPLRRMKPKLSAGLDPRGRAGRLLQPVAIASRLTVCTAPTPPCHFRLPGGMPRSHH